MRAWLTPTAATGDYACRRLTIPVELLPAVTGALEQLIHTYNWEEHGTMTPAEAALLALDMLMTYEQSEGECNMFLGAVIPFTAIPSGINDVWLLCDGASYLKADYPQYWQHLVNTSHDIYWEVDATHFAVPDARERFIMGTDADIGLTGGEATHVLTVAEMPGHTHSEVVTSIPVPVIAPGEAPAVPSGTPGVTGSTGGGAAHNNIPPYLMLYPCLRVKP